MTLRHRLNKGTAFLLMSFRSHSRVFNNEHISYPKMNMKKSLKIPKDNQNPYIEEMTPSLQFHFTIIQKQPSFKQLSLKMFFP